MLRVIERVAYNFKTLVIAFGIKIQTGVFGRKLAKMGHGGQDALRTFTVLQHGANLHTFILQRLQGWKWIPFGQPEP